MSIEETVYQGMARRIEQLETELAAALASQAQPAELSPEFYAEYEYKYPDWDVVVSVYQRRNDNEPLLIHQELLKGQFQSQAQQESQWIIPTESQIIAATEKAGLWPNTVYTWLPAFHRYHAELAKLPPAPEGDKK